MVRTAPSPTVLVVEDEVIVRLSIAEYLRGRGFRAFEAGNADEAVTLLRSGFVIDAVFSDVRIPGSMSGFGLASWLRQAHPQISVLLTSGYLHSAEVATQVGEKVALLEKPYSHELVLQRIQELLLASSADFHP